jgi:F-type H+-transporting ATPase subunit delta
LAEEPALRQLLWNPGVEAEDKVGVLERVLAEAWSQLVRAFLWVVVSLGRSEYLPQIIEAFGETVDADRGRLRVVVRSAHPLSDAVLERLRAMLERREGKTVELEADLDSQLLGGVQVQLDHRVIDGTVRRQLIDLRERLASIKV